MTAKEKLMAEFGETLFNHLMSLITSGNVPEIDPEQFAAEVSAIVDREKALRILERSAKIGILDTTTRMFCSEGHCDSQLDDDDVHNHECPACGARFDESGQGPKEKAIYLTNSERSREPSWIIAIHGFNTLGPWQEEFSWRIANKLKFSVPVFTYKYGLIRFSVLWRFRHIILAKQIGQKILQAKDLTSDSSAFPPDVIVHSFGSHLFTVLLELSEFKHLKFGRVITVGSIIRPDYNWSNFIESGRIEAVLNSCSGGDCAVPFAQTFIPGSGPGGKIGFADTIAINVIDLGGTHSSYFDDEALERNLGDGGLWTRFLSNPLSSFSYEEMNLEKAAEWHPTNSVVLFLVRHVLVFSLLLLIVAMSLALLYFGLDDVFSFMLHK